jgi:NADH dehydrogenase (ubiquinone) Fe-S protein 4
VLTNVVGNGKDLHVPKNIAELAALSGMPADQAKRVVVIAQRQLKTLQSGQRLSHQWQITWKNTERWSNPLMGWTSTADPMSNVKLNFDTQEAAVAFANRNGWKYEIRAETSKTNTPPGTYLYKHNFLDKRVSGVSIIS